MKNAILHLKQGDPVLARVIEAVGEYKIEYMEPDFESVVRSIVFQQLSGKVARVILNRLLDAARNGDARLTPEAVLKLRAPRLRKIGLSAQKTEYIRDLARRAKSGELDFAALRDLADEEVCERLTEVKGIGIWTAQMFLIFALRRADVLPCGDLGVRAAIRKLYGLEELPKPPEIQELARNWRPYCSVATWYLWRSLSGEAAL